jgi:uracil-DNA glycosylase family 4
MTLDYGPSCCANRPKGIRGFGNTEADIMLIGIAPGNQEVRAGRPFVGASGNLLDAVLEAVHVKREDLYLTNLCCWLNNEPSKDEVMQCAPRLIEEIATVKPKLIVGLGSVVSQVLLGRKVTKGRGYVVRYQSGSDVFAPHDHFRLMTYHPSAFLQGTYNYIYDIVNDLGKINDIITKPVDGSWGRVSYNTVGSTRQAQEVMDSFKVGSIVTCDIETTSDDGEAKDIFTDDILCICFTGSTGTYAIPVEFLGELIWRSDVKWGFHVGIFDVVGIRKIFNQQIRIGHDSLLSSYAIDERAGKEYQTAIHGLGPLAGGYQGGEFYKEKLDRKRLAQYPMPVVLDYCSHDAQYTYNEIQRHAPLMIEEGTQELYDNILLPAANVFADISYDGCKIDQELKHSLQLAWLPQWFKLQRRMTKMANEAGFEGEINVNSNQQMAKLLYDLLSLPQRSRSDRSVDRDHIDELDHPFIETLLEFRTLDKMIGTYLIGFDNDIKPDGCVHPVPLLHGTSTGRLSYQGPPIQTIPKPFRVGKDLGAFRRMFVPHDAKTHCFVEVDYEQLEIWIAQSLSGDKQMLADLQSGDYHGRVTTTVYGLEPKTKADPEEEYLVWNERRTQAKRITFQRLYQGGASTLANKHTGIGCSLREAQAYIQLFNERYPEYNQWCHDTVLEVSDGGFLKTCFGRKRRFPVIRDHSQIRQALNFPIQSIASDVCLTSLIELHWILKEWNSRVVWTVHDAILFEVAREHFDKVVAIIKEVMTKPRHPSLPELKIDITAGNNYYDQVKLKDYTV